MSPFSIPLNDVPPVLRFMEALLFGLQERAAELGVSPGGLPPVCEPSAPYSPTTLGEWTNQLIDRRLCLSLALFSAIENEPDDELCRVYFLMRTWREMLETIIHRD